MESIYDGRYKRTEFRSSYACDGSIRLELGNNLVMKRILLLASASFLLALTASASQPAASELIAQARTAALTQHKNIFVMFDASW